VRMMSLDCGDRSKGGLRRVREDEGFCEGE